MPKVLVNRILPFKGFKALNLFGLIFLREECRGRFCPSDLNHERIHTAQMLEWGILLYYPLYLGEWVFNLFRFGVKDKEAYLNISFEKEAFGHEAEPDYLEGRRHYANYRKDKSSINQ